MSMPEVVTFGCRLNAYESEVMKKHAIAAGLTDAVIVNTCAVTAEAERQARQSIRRLRRERPGARIIVTGCAAQVDPVTFSSMPEVDHVIGNDKKMEASVFQELGGAVGEGCKSSSPFVRDETGRLSRQNGDLQRAFIQVQQGCDHRCTFCIIPYGRGASRSMPIGAIAEEVRARVKEGYREVVFTGVDIASYGGDLPGQPRLGQMIRRVLAQVPELPRLRLSSLDPAAMDEDLWRLIAEEPRLMPHLHLSVQAGDDMILKRMKRRHARADVIELCTRARRLRPDIAFGADFIAGFPTETDAMFENTLRLVEECDLTWLHVFPYSARKGTPAAKMPQVNGAVRRERAARLREMGAVAAARHMQELVGQKFDVLIEQQGLGCTRQFAKVRLEGVGEVGGIVEAECVRLDQDQAVAIVI
jgi:threonylcarbamoyladenosine tRNA methylthiotransferase MtaB